MPLPTATQSSQTQKTFKKTHLHVKGPGVDHPGEDGRLVGREGKSEGREKERRGVRGKRVVVGLGGSGGEARGEAVGVGRHEQRLSTSVILVLTVPLSLALIILNLHRKVV